jgi:FlgD Ig-like domain
MSRPRPKNLVTAGLALLLCLAAVLPAAAQGGWDRRIEGLSLTQTPTGLWEVRAVWDVLLTEAQSAPIDLDTRVDLRINGTVVATIPHTVGIDPGGASCADGSSCGGSCGTGIIDGQSATLICRPNGPCDPICDCACGTLPIQSAFDPVPMTTGDEIMVILYPAPGALPDPDTSDDQLVVTHDGGEIFWDRRITSLTVEPSAAGPGWDVTAEGTIFHEGVLRFAGAGNAVPLDTELELRVNGVPVATADLPFQPVPVGTSCSCGNECGSWNGIPHFCVLTNLSGCHCGWPWISTFPGVGDLSPGDEIMVILRPAPGALPELPGFPDDDRSVTFSPSTGAPESVSAAAGELRQNRPNPFRARTQIAFTTRGATDVRLDLFDVAGRRVRTLLDGHYDRAGTWSATWDGFTASGRPAPGGIYFYRLTAGGTTQTRKMTLAK